MINLQKLRTAEIVLDDETYQTYEIERGKVIKIIEISKEFIRYFGEWDTYGKLVIFTEEIIPIKDVIRIYYVFDDEISDKVNISLAKLLEKNKKHLALSENQTFLTNFFKVKISKNENKKHHNAQGK